MKLNLAYYASLGVLGGLLAMILGFVLFPTPRLPEVQRNEIHELPDEWVLSYQIVGHDKNMVGYMLTVAVDGQEVSKSRFTLKPDGKYTYVYHVRPEQLGSGMVTLTVYDERRYEPIDKVTYSLSSLERAKMAAKR